MAGQPAHPKRRIQVASFDTLRDRRTVPPADVLVIDEAHHVMADTYRSLVTRYPDARVLGLTATPERGDGRPLGDIFDDLVVAADYSELIKSGDLVNVEGKRTLAFFSRLSEVYNYTGRFTSEGQVPAAFVESKKTPTSWRDEVLHQFSKGRYRVLCSVDVLTEGVDVPVAQVALSSRSFQHVGTMLQCFGRVMRPSDGKKSATVIDLTGATHVHGLPNEDREYSLKTDKPIRRKNGDVFPVVEREYKEPTIADVGMEVATLGKRPKKALRKKLVWSRPSAAFGIPESKKKAIRRKRGRRHMEYVVDHYARMEW